MSELIKDLRRQEAEIENHEVFLRLFLAYPFASSLSSFEIQLHKFHSPSTWLNFTNFNFRRRFGRTCNFYLSWQRWLLVAGELIRDCLLKFKIFGCNQGSDGARRKTSKVDCRKIPSRLTSHTMKGIYGCFQRQCWSEIFGMLTEKNGEHVKDFEGNTKN